jgi:integrase
MFLSKRANGIYYIYYNNVNGKRVAQSTNAKTKKEAIIFLSQFSEQRKSFNNNQCTKKLNEFAWEYLLYSESVHRPKTTKEYKSIFNDFANSINNPVLSDITTQIIEEYLRHKTKTSLFTAQKHLAYLRSAFNKAVSDKYINSNPFAKIDNFRLPQQQPKFFDQHSYHLLMENIQHNDMRDIVTFAANTGLRQMEILKMKWSQINLVDRQVILDNYSSLTKSKKVRAVPLNSLSMEVLNRRREKCSVEYVFTYDGKLVDPNKFRKRFKKIVRKAELNDKLNFHSLRHSTASWLVQKGIPIYQVSKILGHSDVKTTQIYANLRTDDLREAMETLDYK